MKKINCLTYIPLLFLSCIVTFLFGASIKALSNQMDDVIIQEDSVKIYVKQYKTSMTVNDKKEFEIKIDSTYKIFKQKQILHEGKLLKAEHDPEHYIVIEENGKKVTVKEIFSHTHINDMEDNIGKHIIITQVYYPKERIFYKLQ